MERIADTSSLDLIREANEASIISLPVLPACRWKAMKRNFEPCFEIERTLSSVGALLTRGITASPAGDLQRELGEYRRKPIAASRGIEKMESSATASRGRLFTREQHLQATRAWCDATPVRFHPLVLLNVREAGSEPEVILTILLFLPMRSLAEFVRERTACFAGGRLGIDHCRTTSQTYSFAISCKLLTMAVNVYCLHWTRSPAVHHKVSNCLLVLTSEVWRRQYGAQIPGCGPGHHCDLRGVLPRLPHVATDVVGPFRELPNRGSRSLLGQLGSAHGGQSA